MLTHLWFFYFGAGSSDIVTATIDARAAAAGCDATGVVEVEGSIDVTAAAAGMVASGEVAPVIIAPSFAHFVRTTPLKPARVRRRRKPNAFQAIAGASGEIAAGAAAAGVEAIGVVSGPIDIVRVRVVIDEMPATAVEPQVSGVIDEDEELELLFLVDAL